MHGTAGLKKVHQQHANNQGYKRSADKQQQRFAADPANSINIAHFRHTHYQGGEYQRSDDHFDEPQEDIAQYGKTFQLIFAFTAILLFLLNLGFPSAFECGIRGIISGILYRGNLRVDCFYIGIGNAYLRIHPADDIGIVNIAGDHPEYECDDDVKGQPVFLHCETGLRNYNYLI